MLHQPITADWTRDVRAQRILASFTANPPRTAKLRFQEAGRDSTFVGYRAEVLAKIQDQHGAPILTECQRTGDYAEFKRFCDQPSVDDAIMAALSTEAAVDAVFAVARRIAA